MKPALVSSIFLLAASPCLGAEPVGTGDAEEGFVYAKEVCANCHAIVPNQASPVPEAPTFDEIAKQLKGSAKSAVEIIQAVHPPKQNIPWEQDELDDLAAYLLSFDN